MEAQKRAGFLSPQTHGRFAISLNRAGIGDISKQSLLPGNNIKVFLDTRSKLLVFFNERAGIDTRLVC